MKAAMIFSAALRESRGARGRLLFFVLCLALGVSAVTGVSALVASIETALHAQSRELLGADVSVSSRRPIPPEIDAYFLATASERADVRELATLASHESMTRLVELKAISSTFPFFGQVSLDPPARLGELLTPDRCAVGSDFMLEAGLELGDRLAIGGREFEIAARVLDEPGRLDIAFTLGPRVFISLDGLALTELESFGSRIRYRALYRLRDGAPQSFVDLAVANIQREREDAAYLRIESHHEAQPTVRRSLDRFASYLGLVALLSLILGGTGVAQIVRAWVAARTQSVAVLRVIGFRPRDVLAMYLGNVALLALVGSAIGALAGSLLPFAVIASAPDLVPKGHSVVWELQPVLEGIALGLAVALVFSVPPLTAIWRVAPVRVLRNDIEPLPAPRIVTWSAFTLLAAGIFAAAWVQSHSLVLAASFTGGLGFLALLLSLAAKTLTFLAARVPREGLDPYLRHGIAALARPGVGVTGATVALGLGVLVIASMVLIDGRLAARLRSALPADAPSIFLVDVQPDQWPAIDAELQRLGAQSIQSVPVLTARLTAIDGVDVKELATRRENDDGVGRQRWVLTREQRLTWMEKLPADNKIVAGELWSDPQRYELSLEEKFAEDLGVGVGETLSFDVQGVPIDLTVTSLRTVEWESFGINFFLVAEPGALDLAPHFRIAAARLDPEGEMQLQREIAARFANISPVRIRPILDKLLAVFSRLALGVRVLGMFTVLTGLAILAGVASSTALHRGREVALLKTLGLTRWGVVRLFGIEFALVGMVAGLIGACAAFALAFGFLEYVVDTPANLPWWAIVPSALFVAGSSALCGLLASVKALASRPIESLRG